MKPGENVCLNQVSDKFEDGSCQVKNYVTMSNLRTTVRKAQVSDSGSSWPFCLLKKRYIEG